MQTYLSNAQVPSSQKKEKKKQHIENRMKLTPFLFTYKENIFTFSEFFFFCFAVKSFQSNNITKVNFILNCFTLEISIKNTRYFAPISLFQFFFPKLVPESTKLEYQAGWIWKEAVHHALINLFYPDWYPSLVGSGTNLPIFSR